MVLANWQTTARAVYRIVVPQFVTLPPSDSKQLQYVDDSAKLCVGSAAQPLTYSHIFQYVMSTGPHPNT